MEEYTIPGFGEWLRQAYREPEDRSQLDAPRFTRWNMEVAYRAGMDRLTGQVAQLQRFKWNDDQMARLQERDDFLEKEVADYEQTTKAATWQIEIYREKLKEAREIISDLLDVGFNVAETPTRQKARDFLKGEEA